MALPPSKLAKVISDLPDDFNMAAKSIPNMLKRKGVKEEELKFAELGLPEPNSTLGMEQWNKSQLTTANLNRKDFQEVKKKVRYADYGEVNVVARTDGYEERIYKFEHGSDYSFRSSHFPEDGRNYLAHARVQPMALNGKKVRTILEVQSDAEVFNRGLEKSNTNALANIDRDIASVQAGNQSMIDYYGGKEVALEALESRKQELQAQIMEPNPSASMPYKENMTRKLLEREIFAAVEEGAEYTAIPIKGSGTESLYRSPEIQKHYETTVLNTAKKIAKQQGLEVATETSNATSVDERLVANLGYELARLQQNASNVEALDSLESFAREARFENTPLGDILQTISSVRRGVNEPEELIAELSNIVNNPRVLAPETRPVEYLVIKHPQGTKLDMNLYATPTATAGGAYLAYKAGYSEQEVADYLVNNQGYEPEEAQEMSTKVKAAINAGYSEEDVKQYMEGQDPGEPELFEDKKPPARPESIVKPLTPEQARQMTHTSSYSSYSNEVKAATELTVNTAKDLVASQTVLKPVMASTLDQTSAFFGFDNKKVKYVNEQLKTNRQQLANFAAQKGVEIKYSADAGEWLVNTESGWKSAEPSMWADLWKAKGEIVGSIGGFMAGARAGVAATSAVNKLGAYGKAANFIGGAIGGIGGAVVGSEVDYIWEAMMNQQELELAAQQQRMLNAGQAAAMGELVGAAVFKLAKGTVPVIKAIKDAPGQIVERIAGESAVDKALADTMFLNRDEAQDLVRIMERFAEVPGETAQDKRIAAALYSQPGSEGIASAAAQIDPLTSRAIAKTIDARAQDLLKTANSLTDENLSRLVTQDLKNYEDDVKNFYTDVKLRAAKAPLSTMHQFDVDQLAVMPVLESLKKNIDDPRTMEKFLLQMSRVQNYGLTRNFNDLLELRKVVNNFKYNTKITSAKDFERVNEVVKNIDNQIASSAKQVIPDSDKWLADFKDANMQYAKMMNVKKNVLYKALTKPGQDYNTTVRALTKYITAEDSTFVDVMATLPKQTKLRVEGSVIEALTEKFTAGAPGGERAVHFPQLSSALEKVTFTSPEARKFKSAVTELAEVFRNDVPLAQVSGSLSPPRDVSLLTSDLLAATKRTIAQKVFNTARRLTGDGPAKLVHKAAKALESPLNTKSMQELMDELGDAVNIDEEARSLMSAAARQQAETGETSAPKVLLYGTGKILSAKGSGTPVKVARHRIATLDDVTKIAEGEGISRGDTKALDAILIEMGYKAVQQGSEKVRLLE